VYSIPLPAVSNFSVQLIIKGWLLAALFSFINCIHPALVFLQKKGLEINLNRAATSYYHQTTGTASAGKSYQP
jgi:hypothetical protein